MRACPVAGTPARAATAVPQSPQQPAAEADARKEAAVLARALRKRTEAQVSARLAGVPFIQDWLPDGLWQWLRSVRHAGSPSVVTVQ